VTPAELQTQPALFDYESLEPDVRADVQEATARLHELERRTSESIIEIGMHLLTVKAALPHGQFGDWLDVEFGWSQDTAGRFVAVAKRFGEIPQFAEFASPSAMYALASGNVPESIRTYFIERAESGEPIRHKDVVDAIEQWKLDRDMAALRNAPGLPHSTYRVLYVDPPWQYNDQLVEGYGPAENHYPTMHLDDLKTFFDDRGRSVEHIAADNSVLFMWATSPLLDDALELIKAWGFTYKTSFVWDKVKHNYGHYNSVRHELLLIATRGSCVPDTKQLFDSVQVIERTSRHSEKPEEFRQIIDTLYSQREYVDRIELFRRGSAPEGWHVWGNEVAGN